MTPDTETRRLLTSGSPSTPGGHPLSRGGGFSMCKQERFRAEKRGTTWSEGMLLISCRTQRPGCLTIVARPPVPVRPADPRRLHRDHYAPWFCRWHRNLSDRNRPAELLVLRSPHCDRGAVEVTKKGSKVQTARLVLLELAWFKRAGRLHSGLRAPFGMAFMFRTCAAAWGPTSSAAAATCSGRRLHCIADLCVVSEHQFALINSDLYTCFSALHTPRTPCAVLALLAR